MDVSNQMDTFLSFQIVHENLIPGCKGAVLVDVGEVSACVS